MKKINKNKQNSLKSQTLKKEDPNFTDGILKKIEKDYLYLKDVSRGLSKKKIKLAENSEYEKMILSKVDDQEKKFKVKTTEKIKKTEIEEGDEVSIAYIQNKEREKIANKIRKVTIENSE